MKKKYENELCYRQSRMQENNVHSPKEAIESFFNNFALQEARTLLWDFYSCCVGYYSREGTHHEAAHQSLFFYTEMEMLLEATWLIWKTKIKQ